jgi:hypothetical protein
MIKRFAAALALTMAASLAPLVAHDGHVHRIMGTVTVKDAKHLEVKTPGGETLSIAISDKTFATRAKRKVALDEIKPGARVVVDIGNGEDPLIAGEIQVGATKIVETAGSGKK